MTQEDFERLVSATKQIEGFIDQETGEMIIIDDPAEIREALSKMPESMLDDMLEMVKKYRRNKQETEALPCVPFSIN